MKLKILAMVHLSNSESEEAREGVLLENIGIIYPEDPTIIQGCVVSKFLNIELVNDGVKLFISE